MTAVYWPGIGYLFYTVMLAGIIQIVFGVFRAGKLLRMISAPVVMTVRGRGHCRVGFSFR